MRYTELDANKRVKRSFNSDANGLPANIFIDTTGQADPTTDEMWNGSAFVPYVAPADTGIQLKRQDFIDLFGLKQFDIIAAATSSHTSFNQDVAVVWQRTIASDTVNTIHPATIYGMSVLVTALLITQAESDSILSGVAI